MRGKSAGANYVLGSATLYTCQSVHSLQDDHGAHGTTHRFVSSHCEHLGALWSDVVTSAAAASRAFKLHIQDGSHVEFDAINRQ
ncbi:hypothetical protein [Hydrogenophaga sp.]|uniref:hypothetical protein n=1 Tax=Hydrogenophaga sp. TaxID=1904254 RepID=UPI0027284AA5|nr:hypothetical protein [Hydrogenophaga sp.]MDO9133623.1 hypothetical protein [Hydrogenophaga sp.]